MIGFNFIASPGDLGNQMFKYAALRGIAKTNNKDFLIPPSYYKLEKYKPLYKLYVKTINPKIRQNHLLFDCFKMESVNQKNIGYIETDNLIKEKQFHFDPDFFSVEHNNFDILGYFQSEKYFKNVSDIIRSDFQFKDNIDKRSKSILLRLVNPVSIHVRRGDYLTNPNHSSLNISYYRRAISRFDHERTFLIFSDDTNWCKKQHIFSNKNFLFAEDFTKGIKYLDLSLMSKCNDHIIANSTFSWWGAWLSNSKNIYAPKHWFKNSKYEDYDTKDLYPENWNLINHE